MRHKVFSGSYEDITKQLKENDYRLASIDEVAKILHEERRNYKKDYENILINGIYAGPRITIDKEFVSSEQGKKVPHKYESILSLYDWHEHGRSTLGCELSALVKHPDYVKEFLGFSRVGTYELRSSNPGEYIMYWQKHPRSRYIEKSNYTYTDDWGRDRSGSSGGYEEDISEKRLGFRKVSDLLKKMYDYQEMHAFGIKKRKPCVKTQYMC